MIAIISREIIDFFHFSIVSKAIKCNKLLFAAVTGQIEIRMEIKPGQSIRIVLNIDHIKEITDVRSSTIFDVVEKKLIIAQTYPPILKSKVGKAVIVTYLAKGKDGLVRYGFDATILGLISNYELSAGNATRAAVLLRKSEPVEYNLRFFFRVEPPSTSGLALSVYRKPVNILDISIGGAKISHDRSLKLEAGKIVTISLSIDGEDFEVNASVIRTWAPEEARMVRSLEFVALGFVDTNMHLKNVLGRKLFEIQRELRSRELS
jgi:hypothetical protein